MKTRVLTPEEQEAERKANEVKRHKKAWADLTRGMTFDAWLERYRENIRQAFPHDTQFVRLDENDPLRIGGWRDSIYARANRGWATECDVTINVSLDYGKAVTNPDDSMQRAYPVTVSCQVSWSSTHRSVSASLAAVSLYRDMIEGAARVEALAQETLYVIR